MTRKLSGVKINPETKKAQGRFVWIVYNKHLDKRLKKLYGRSGLCLKVLREEESNIWEVTKLNDVTRLQNIAAFYGLAPRVYDVVKVGNHLAQVTDFLQSPNEPSLEAISRLIGFVNKFDIGTKKLSRPRGVRKYDIAAAKNWVGDKFVDWGGLFLRFPGQYLDDLIKRASINITREWRGKPATKTYQSLGNLKIYGSREAKSRVEKMKLAEIDFTGKTVLDLGCNLGFFCHYAHGRNARRVTGVDVPELAGPTMEIANWLGCWNVDIIGAELPRELDKIVGPYDIVFAFSICNHVGGYRKWISDLCKETLILEGHGGDEPKRYEAQLKRDFKKVELINYSTDLMTRPIFRCEK